MVVEGGRAGVHLDEATRAWMAAAHPERADLREGGDYVEVDLEAGSVLWSTKGSVHDTINVGDTPWRMLIVELKS